MIQIFVSRPTWLPGEFQQGLGEFLGLLEMLELSPRTLGVSDYPAKGPLDEVIDLLDECRGMIVLGYPQLVLMSGTVKGTTVANICLATEWNHIEASLAYAKRLPLLVIHHMGVCRGIFDRGTLNSFVYERDLSKAGWSLAPDIRGALAKWKSKLSVDSAEPSEIARDPLQMPICPNCSTTQKAIYLSPIPKEFVEIEAASHECTKCGFKRPPNAA